MRTCAACPRTSRWLTLVLSIPAAALAMLLCSTPALAAPAVRTRIMATARERDRVQREMRRDPGAAFGSLPATFAGLLPCADCPGIRYRLDLLPGGAFIQRMTYLRDGHDDSFYDIGRWSLAADGRSLTLEGGRNADSHWALQDAGTLRKLDRESGAIDSSLPCEITRRSALERMEPRLQMTGMFRAMADAPRFRDCRSGLEWPVATSDDYRTLESTYMARRSAPGSELMVSLNGRIEQHRSGDREGLVPTLVVERFARAMPGERCAERAPGQGIAETRWRPVRIAGRLVTVSVRQSEPWIELDSHTSRVTGSGGCNRITGGYAAHGNTLRFVGLVSTRMACLSMDTENAFMHALDATRRYRVDGRVLELLDEAGRSLAQLEERNLR